MDYKALKKNSFNSQPDVQDEMLWPEGCSYVIATQKQEKKVLKKSVWWTWS